MMMKLASAVLMACATVAAADSAAAREPRSGQDYAIAESRFGHGTVRGAVRPGKWGPQVQTPGGNWIDCRRLCSETLRVETVDFWENHSSAKTDNEAGFFGPLRIQRSW